MRTSRPKSLLERSPDADLWRHTLSQIPTAAGRLVYLGTLRNQISGKYEHHGLALLFGEEPADKAIRLSHRRTFQEWLELGLEAKTEDLYSYFESLDGPVLPLIQHWLRSQAWLAFLPSSIVPAEKSLFSSDMRNALRVLLGRHGAVAPDQTA